MKKLKILICIIFPALILSSCDIEYVSLEPEARETWINHTLAEIIQTYGAPTREADDGLGGKIVIYENRETVVETNTTSPYPYVGLYGFYYHISDPFTNTRVTTTERVDYAHFYMDSKNICYDVKTNLERPVSKNEKFAKGEAK